MTSDTGSRNAEDSGPGGPGRPTATIVIIFNSITAGLGGLYAGTHSLPVTVLAAVLAAVLTFIAVRGRIS